jgi:hypothetical protein
MTLLALPRVMDITVVQGTGTIQLSNSPVNGFNTFQSSFTNGDQTPYLIIDQGTYVLEYGIATYSNGTLERSIVQGSTNGTEPYDFVGNKCYIYGDASPPIQQSMGANSVGRVPMLNANGQLDSSFIANTGGSDITGNVVLSFDGRTGNVTLMGNDVTMALGYTPLSNTANLVWSFNTRTGNVMLQSNDVTTALGYTPLSNTANLVWTFNGRTGNVTLTSNDVTTALGYVPSNSETAESATYVRTAFTATAGQTTFDVTYTPGYLEVYLNGVLQDLSDYTASNGQTIEFNMALNAGDNVIAVSYTISTSVTPTYIRTTFTPAANQTTFDVTYSPQCVEVYLNGVLLNSGDYTASTGTSIVLGIATGTGDIVDVVAFNTANIGITTLMGGMPGEVLYQSNVNVTNTVPAGTPGQIFFSGGANAPYWSSNIVANAVVVNTSLTVPVATSANQAPQWGQTLGAMGTTYVNQMSNRSLGVTYTNSTGGPIAISVYSVQASVTDQDFIGYVNGAPINYSGQLYGASVLTIYFIVPPGDTYMVTVNEGAYPPVNGWYELGI